MNWSKIIPRVKSEFIRAEKKHPVFADKFCNHSLMWYQVHLKDIRDLNDTSERCGDETVERILQEETLEVFEAASLKDEKQTIEELIQVIVVCLRAIYKIFKDGL